MKVSEFSFRERTRFRNENKEIANALHFHAKKTVAVRLAHFVYTKSETSPFKKTGFHFCAYTLSAFTPKDLLAIETHIHFPEISGFGEKRTFFSLNGRPFVMYMRSLPEDRDAFGRGGMFIVHGMELPSEMYAGHKFLARIVESLQGYAFTSRAEAFDPRRYNAETGDLSPLEVLDELLLKPRTTIPALNVAERAGLLTALKTASESEAALCLEAPPKEALVFFDKIFAWLPPEHKKKFAFDEAFDGGKLFFFPVKLTAYTQTAPVTGTPVFIVRDSVGPPETSRRWATADGYFARWAGRETTPQTLETAWAADDFLSRKSLKAPETDEDFCLSFAAANESELRRDAEKAATQFIEPALAAATVRNVAPAALLKLKFLGFEPAKFAPVIEAAVLQTAFFGRRPLPPAYQTPLTRLLSFLWENQTPHENDVFSLSPDERRKFANYLAESPRAHETWACDLVAKIGVESQTWEKMHPHLLKIAQKRLPKTLSSLERLPEHAVVAAQRLPPDNQLDSWLSVLDDYCANHPQIWTIVAKKLKNNGVAADFPFLSALTTPETTNFAAFDDEIRPRFVRVLREVHRWADNQLQAAGFNDQDLKKTDASGIAAALKKLVQRLLRQS